MAFKITGLDKLTGNSTQGYSGILRVKVSGIGSKKGFSFDVSVQNAHSLEAAKVLALTDLKDFARTLLSEVSEELSLILS
jgi:hypothetical protein